MQHDASYKKLMQFPAVFAQFAGALMPAELVEQIDFSTVVALDSAHQGPNFESRSSDVIFRFRLKNGRCAYAFILLEFQSSSQPFMALRLLNYVAMYYQKIADTTDGLKVGELPVAWPFVLHTGRGRWSAPRDVRTCLDMEAAAQAGPALLACIPQMSYGLIDASSYELEFLESLEQEIGYILALETTRQGEAALRVAKKLLACIYREGNEALQRAMLEWFTNVFRPGKGAWLKQEDLNNLPTAEVTTMIANHMEVWEKSLGEHFRLEGIKEGKREGKREGRLEGKLEGRLEGRKEGEQSVRVEFAQALLNAKFSALGNRFFNDHLAGRHNLDWEVVVRTIKQAQNLDQLWPIKRP